MQLIILAGFLGSGKTSILLHLARYLAAKENFRPGALVIIENEIGTAGVDGKALGGQGYQVRELTAGCICCTLAGDLLATVDEIKKDLGPRWLLIEATGIAQHRIADLVRQHLGYGAPPPLTLALADAERWFELMDGLPMLISRQIEGADLVLINKSDLVAPETLAAVTAEVRALTGPETPSYPTSAVAEAASQEAWLAELWKCLVQHE